MQGHGARSTWRAARALAIATLATLAALACGDGAGRPGSAADTAMVVPDAPLDRTGWAVTEVGIGPIRVGMTAAEASDAVAEALVMPAGVEPGACGYLVWRDGIPGVGIMVEQGTIARIDVDSGAVATEAGVRVGDPEERVRSAYAGRVSEMPHKYTSGRYLVVAPVPPTDSTLRLVFETDGVRVTRYRAGRMPQVMYVERCG